MPPGPTQASLQRASENEESLWIIPYVRMPIPPFESTGLLPPGRHRCTPEEIRVSLVDAFPHSTRRLPLFAGWMTHRAVLSYLLPYTEQWVNGSFAESAPEPRDI